MKWIDLDASCKTRQQFISDIESEGLWDILDEGKDSLSVLMTKKGAPDETADVFFGAIWAGMGVSNMTISKTINCAEALHSLEEIGFPTFSDDYFFVASQFNFYLPIEIGSTVLMIGGVQSPVTCEEIVYTLAQNQ